MAETLRLFEQCVPLDEIGMRTRDVAAVIRNFANMIQRDMTVGEAARIATSDLRDSRTAAALRLVAEAAASGTVDGIRHMRAREYIHAVLTHSHYGTTERMICWRSQHGL
jgi:deoxyhypusine synthase